MSVNARCHELEKGFHHKAMKNLCVIAVLPFVHNEKLYLKEMAYYFSIVFPEKKWLFENNIILCNGCEGNKENGA